MNPAYAYGTFPARIEIDLRRGPTITIDCGDLPEVPDWLVKELDTIKTRLDSEIAKQAVRDKAAPVA